MTNKLFNSKIQLIPATQHTFFDENQQGALENTLKGAVSGLKLGITDTPVWGKTFKFRFTSTDTGKKIDLNLNVKLIKKKTEVDF